jgi:hypothetical protein
MPVSRARSAAARALRTTALRPGAVRRIPVGLGRGLRLEIDPASTLHVPLGTAEVEIARHLRRLARPGVRSFDVGSNNAYYALVLARLTGSEVAAIEFTADGLARIRRNLERNPGPARQVRVVEAYVSSVVSAQHGSQTLDVLAGWDDLFVPGLLKIDVEGAEVDVLRGAEGLLARHRPHVILETHSAELERGCAELLAGFGYRPVVVSQRRVLREGRSAPHNRWLVAEGTLRA